MAQPAPKHGSDTRQEILHAALKRFANDGYAGTSIQHIVDDAKVSKPALYYYFRDKAGLFQALVDQAHDERYRLMREAARHGRTVGERLVEVAAALFEFSQRNRELMRLAFATAFAAPGEVPQQARNLKKVRRNFELVRALIRNGQASGELDRRFDSEELALGLYGQLNMYVMARLLVADCRLDRRIAERVVELFVRGAAAAKSRDAGARSTRACLRNRGSTGSRGRSLKRVHET
jgi:AcrR family transcriptional regulator